MASAQQNRDFRASTLPNPGQEPSTKAMETAKAAAKTPIKSTHAGKQRKGWLISAVHLINGAGGGHTEDGSNPVHRDVAAFFQDRFDVGLSHGRRRVGSLRPPVSLMGLRAAASRSKR